MYKYRKLKKSSSTKTADADIALKTIDENATIGISRSVQRAEIHKTQNDKKNDMIESTADEDVLESEENVPVSQEITQRYLSQRNTFAASLARTQSRNLTQRPPNTYFELVMMKAGVQLDEGDTLVLSCDNISFVHKFRVELEKSPNFPENIETFKTGLRDALALKSKIVQKLLSGCTITSIGEDNAYQSQDSMIFNFLMIDFLRDHVVEILLEKVAEISCQADFRLPNGDIPLLPLLLAQLRYISHSHGDIIFERIKSIFEKAKDFAKWNIISNAELILNENKHDEFVQMLMDDMAGSKDIFHSTTLQTLTNLNLSNRMMVKLRSKILAYIKEKQCSNTTLPLLVKFLLKFLNNDDEDNIKELVDTLREILIGCTNSYGNDPGEQKSQTDLFYLVEQGLTRSKKFYYIWQKKIANLPMEQFRSIDFIILLLLIRIKEDNSFYIENILRRRIKVDDITVDILTEAKRNYSVILEQHTNTLMLILHDFLKEKHKSVADFAKSSYSILFEICDSIQKNILKKLLELTCDKSTQNLTNMALQLLLELQRKYPKDVHNCGMLLIPLLDRLSDMSLAQTRIVMELLCSIAYPPSTLSESPALADQIDMLVKKQLINRTAYAKKQGIIGSVQLIDSIARISDNCMDAEDVNASFNSVSDLPNGRGKIAANYIVRIQSSTMYCPESLALFYDELASACAACPDDRANPQNLDKPLLIWLCELMTYYFQNNYVSEQYPEETMGIPLSYQKCINTNEDIDDPESELPSIAINIAELALKPKPEACSSILVLAPLFNLVRVLQSLKNNGSLEQINALLGCAIVLPKFFSDDNTDTIFFNYDRSQQKLIIDIYFHCVNWIRETVSSFSNQIEPMIRRKVLHRLADLIQIEAHVRKLLLIASTDYSPPICQFINSSATLTTLTKSSAAHGKPTTTNSQKPTRAKAKANQAESDVLNETDAQNPNVTNFGDYTMNKLASTSKQKASNAKINFQKMYGPKEIYRQMDTEIMLLLTEELNIIYPLPEEEIGKKLGLCEFRFVLTDIISKLESVTGVQKLQGEQQFQHINKPFYLMNDLSKFFGNICENKEMIAAAIKKQVELVGGLFGHADLFTDAFSYLKCNFSLCLRLLMVYFSWSDFVAGSRNDLLKDSLLALMDPKVAQKLRKKPCADIAVEVFNKFIKYESAVLELKSAMHLYELLVNLRKHSQNCTDKQILKKQTSDLRTLCKTLLCRKWYNYEGTMEKGALCNIYLDELVKGFLKNSDFNRQRSILRILIDESKMLGGKDSVLKSFPNINKANFPLLLRGLCEILISALNEAIAATNSVGTDKLKLWEISCELLNSILEIVEIVTMPRNFILFLKYSHMYLKMVLQYGLPVFELHIRKNPERINELLKDLQITTRFLHNLCCHSKALKTTVVVNQIPFVRETVENFVFRVKALMAANKCASVFCMANLKNKDLHGELIPSQSIYMQADADPNSDEEIPEDDMSADESTIIDTSKEGSDSRNTSSSRSKCF